MKEKEGGAGPEEEKERERERKKERPGSSSTHPKVVMHKRLPKVLLLLPHGLPRDASLHELECHALAGGGGEERK